MQPILTVRLYRQLDTREKKTHPLQLFPKASTGLVWECTISVLVIFLRFTMIFSFSAFLSFLSIKMSEHCHSKDENGRLPTRTTVKYLHIPGT